VRFSKHHGAGNDFLLVDGFSAEHDWSRLAVAMCARNTGAGADGLIIAKPSSTDAVRMVLYNADGSEAEMSGNGVRCFAKYVVENGLARPDGDRLSIETGAGRVVVQLVYEGGEVSGAVVDMGPPRFSPAEVPVTTSKSPPVLDLQVPLNGVEYEVACVSMGNPHAVHFVHSSVADFPLDMIGPRIEHHALFPARVNFEVARIIDSGHIESRTWERGVGETQACGTGACAIMVSARLRGYVGDEVHVREPGGVLGIRWPGEGNVFLTGPAAFVYSGDWPEND
jgi:diaminopimelate epimerase